MPVVPTQNSPDGVRCALRDCAVPLTPAPGASLLSVLQTAASQTVCPGTRRGVVRTQMLVQQWEAGSRFRVSNRCSGMRMLLSELHTEPHACRHPLVHISWVNFQEEPTAIITEIVVNFECTLAQQCKTDGNSENKFRPSIPTNHSFLSFSACPSSPSVHL